MHDRYVLQCRVYLGVGYQQRGLHFLQVEWHISCIKELFIDGHSEMRQGDAEIWTGGEICSRNKDPLVLEKYGATF